LADYNKIYAFMTEYAQFLKETEIKEKNKMNILLSNDVKKVESTMNEYQFTVSAMQKYENKRIELFNSENLAGMTFSQAADTFSGEERKNLKILHAQIASLIENIRQFNKKSLEIANLNLRIMSEINLEADDCSDANCYDRNGTQNGGIRKNSLFNATI